MARWTADATWRPSCRRRPRWVWPPARRRRWRCTRTASANTWAWERIGWSCAGSRSAMRTPITRPTRSGPSAPTSVTWCVTTRAPRRRPLDGIAHLDALVDRHDAREDRDHGEERAREQSDRQRHDGHTRGDQRDLGVLADLLLLELDRVGLVGLHAHTFRIPHLAVQPRSRWSSPRPAPSGPLRTCGWRGWGRSPRSPRRRSCGPA